MTAKELAARLSLPGSLQQQVFSIPISPAQEQEWNELFLRDQEAFELRLHRHPTPELLALALYLRHIQRTDARPHRDERRSSVAYEGQGHALEHAVLFQRRRPAALERRVHACHWPTRID